MIEKNILLFGTILAKLHCWLQRYHARIITFGTSLVYQFPLFKSNQKLSIAFFLLTDEPNGLQSLLGFVKGLEIIPSLGFDQSPRLKFHHPNPVDEYNGYANILTVPVFMSDYDFF